MTEAHHHSTTVHKLRIQIIASFLISLIFIILPFIYLIFFTIPNTQSEQFDKLGNIIAQELANNVTEQIVHQDALGLNVILRQLIDGGMIVYATIYAPNKEVLAEAGSLPEEAVADYRTYTTDITVQDSLVGTVKIILNTSASPSNSAYSFSQSMWIIFAWAVFVLLTVAAYITRLLKIAPSHQDGVESPVTALQKILQTLNPSSNHTDTLESKPNDLLSQWHIVRSAVLVLEFSNLSVLLQRLNNKTMAKLVDECYSNMEMSAKLYNGNLSGWLGKNVVICFNGSNDETEHYFHAICCAELIIGLTNYLNERLAKSNLPRVKLRAALHAGDLLTDANHLLTEQPKHMISEIVSIATEICQHAEHNQLLISDDLYTSDAIAQRLIISDPHVVVLECIDRPITTYAILDLQPSYRELLTRQIQHLITSKIS